MWPALRDRSAAAVGAYRAGVGLKPSRPTWEAFGGRRAVLSNCCSGSVLIDYAYHRGQFAVSSWPYGDAQALTLRQQETVDAILKFYGDKNAQFLSDLTHSERPWRDARSGYTTNDRCEVEITLESMAEYYGSLQ